MSRSVVAVIVVVLAGCVALVATVECARYSESQEPEFVSKEHQFRVRFGAAPARTDNPGAPRSAVYSVEVPGGTRIVAVSEMPIPDDDPPERVPLYLQSAETDLIRGVGGDRISGAARTLAGKYPGREFTARFARPQPGVMRARLFLVGKRLYYVAVKGTEEYVSAPDATAFLESFMVTGEPGA